jgi:hypothetical protein
MLIVEIFVNQKLIGKETALRVQGGENPDDVNAYELSDGTFIHHRYGDGAAKLAAEMMYHLHRKDLRKKVLK